MKNRRSLIIILLILTVGLVGLTIAYFANSSSVDNIFTTQPYGTTVEETFISPDNWLPSDTTDKTITVTNSGKVDEAVRISYQEQWKAKDKTILSGLIDNDGNLTSNTENSEHAAIINFSDNNDWTQSNGYYYYNYRLAPGETTSSLIDSVTFNSKVKNSSNCTTTESNGTKTITCNSTNSGYDGATYTLTFTIETVQYDKYKQAWGVDIATFGMKPMTAQQFISKANPVSITNYTDGNVHEMYTFEHAATEQTPALTDYRYIGDDPNNYVYFNCDSLDNQSKETCEVWRIIGVFDVEDEDGNWETRYKLVRGSSFEETMAWNNEGDWETVNNNWSNASLSIYLNNDYYNIYGETINYGLKKSTKLMIDFVKYYLGGSSYASERPYLGSVEDIYYWERSKTVYNGQPISWNGKISLMYPSDEYMTYSKNVNDTCYNDPNRCNIPDAQKSWLYNTNNFIEDSDCLWLLSPGSTGSWAAFNIYKLGNLNGYNRNIKSNELIRPTLYLKSNVKLIDGNGSESNPYHLGYVDEYPTYTKGQTVTYDNQEYYVMSNSEGNKNYVKLLKKNPLTESEINEFNTDYTSINGEYPYLETGSCTSSNTSNCSTNYDSSSIKNLIDNWSSSYNNDLVSINGYKARLVNNTDIMDYFAYESYYASPSNGYRASSDTPEWAYINGKSYWSMQVSEDSSSQVYGISNTLSSENVYNKLYIRPVINLKKCALNGSC